jgi:hypothetical protein
LKNTHLSATLKEVTGKINLEKYDKRAKEELGNTALGDCGFTSWENEC